MIAGRPVEWRASLIAPSTASVPEFDRKTRFLLGRGRAARVVRTAPQSSRSKSRCRRYEGSATAASCTALHDLGMPIARGGRPRCRHEVEEPIAVDVLDDGALAAGQPPADNSLGYDVEANRSCRSTMARALGTRPAAR